MVPKTPPSSSTSVAAEILDLDAIALALFVDALGRGDPCADETRTMRPTMLSMT